MGFSVQAGWLNAGRTAQQKDTGYTGYTGPGQKGQQIFGGNLNLADDPVEQRRKLAQKQAWKIVGDAWANDQDVDSQVQLRQEHYAQMRDARKDALASLSDVNDDKAVLREFYNITDDSQEQKDLELLEREQEQLGGLPGGGFTEEEGRRLAELHSEPLTEYQERALELNKRAIYHKQEMRDAEQQMQADTAAIKSIGLERLKSNPMLDAKEAAEGIMAEAEDEILGMQVQDALDHIDEEAEKAKEKADKAAEEKEEREEELQEIKQKRAEQEAMILGTREAAEKAKKEQAQDDSADFTVDEMKDIIRQDSPSGDVMQSLEEIKASMSLLEADLKGIKVNQEV